MTVEELVATLGLEVKPEGFEKGQKALESIRGVALAVGGAVIAAGAALAGMVLSTAEAADKIDATSQALGISAQAYQELSYAAQLSNVKTEEFRVGIQALARNALAAARAGGGMADSFRRAGVSVTDSHGKIRPVEELLGDLAEGLSRLPPGAEKTGLAMQLMGDSGAKMLPMLNGGRAGLAAMRQELVALGGELSDAEVKAGGDFSDSMDKLKVALTGLKLAIGGPLLHVAAEFAAALVEWVKQINAVVRSPLRAFLDGLWATLRGALVLVWTPIKVIVEGLYEAIDSTIGWGNALAALGGIAAAYLLPVAAPFIFVAAVIAALLLLFQDFIVYLQGGDSLIGRFIESASGLWTALMIVLRMKWQQFMDGVSDKAKEIADQVAGFFRGLFNSAIDFWKGVFTGFWEWLVTKAKGLSGQLLSTIRGVVDAVPGGEFVVQHLFGAGASSPAASVQNAPSGAGGGSNSFSVTQHITSNHGETAADIGKASADGLEDFHNRKMAEAAAAVG